MFEVADNKFSADERRLLTGIGILLVLLVALFGLPTLFSDLSPCGNEELSRIKSPRGNLEAVLVQSDCGATTSFVCEFAVVSSGQSPQENQVFFRADKINPHELTLRWLTPNRLKVSVKSGRIWIRKELAQTGTKPVEVIYAIASSCEDALK